MKRLALFSALLLVCAVTSAAAAPQLPQIGHYGPDVLQRARFEAASQALGTPESFEISTGQMDGIDPLTGASLNIQQPMAQAPGGDHVLLADDNDTAHYNRGRTLVINVFINHTGGTFVHGAEGQRRGPNSVAKDHYVANAPAERERPLRQPGDERLLGVHGHARPTTSRTAA